MAESSVRVAVRVRPMAAKELLANSCSCVDFIPGAPQLVVGGGPGCGVGTDAVYGFAQKSFSFDYVFDDNSTQQELYTQCVLPLVLRFLDGFNATILAYGQTGSGKTYSMGIGLEGLSPTNALSGQGISHSITAGIVPRAISDLFNQISVLSRKSESYDAKVSVSFLELHNEELIDLLNTRPRTATGGPTIREDGHGNIVWLNLSEETVQSTAEILSILQRGSLCRTTGSTDMNATSSRSHAIFTVTLRQTNIPNNEGGTNGQSLISKFHFVDLAGSERLKRTNAEGDRKKEGISINQGLLALGNVISALGDESRKSGHVPYRDSKLTRMLQDSLGGNSQTLMLACISPSDLNYGETVNTLHYANRARNIKNKVAVNQDWGNAGSGDMYREVKSLRTIISQLRTEIALIRAGSHTDAPSAEPAFPFAHKEIEFRERRERDQNSEIEELKLKLAASTFQMERFQFHSFRLLERVQSQAQQILELTTERDTAIAEKCQILHTYASDPNALPHLDVNTSGKTAINSKEVWTTDLTDETPMVELPFKKKLKTSNGCSPVSSGTNTPETGKRSRSPVLADTPPTENKVISKMIREYQSTITNLQIQLAECEDKLAWQHEAMAKLGRNGGKSNFAWTENKLDEFNIPHNPMLKQIKIISSENLNNTNDVHREKEVMRALRENIELQEAISNLASGEETKLNIQSIMNEAFQDVNN
ncbi:P-loop containing nucleoside triphosphate hydrolase protein [Globomyces pollinis-pini]|nr:P-loop containing nucleoside triphosphate hydrolase protein [Globomyces pollinis-pini]